VNRPARTLFALTAAMAVATGITWPAPALASRDWDGDLFTETDCRPLDPAVHPLATDYPDLTFEDMNCDGIDGDRTGAYFVSPSGADTNPGTDTLPFATVGRALLATVGTATKSIYVANGTYEETLNLSATHNGVRVYGGYQPGTWARTRSAATVVDGHPTGAILQGARDVVFQLITLRGTYNGAGPVTTYGIRAIDTSEFALIGATATAGPGGTGAAGVQFGGTAVKGAKGTDGASPTGCSTPGAGGSGATATSNGYMGGAGGTGGATTNDGENGAPGTKGGGANPPEGGAPGDGGVDEAGTAQSDLAAMDGKVGQPGQDGADGPSGTGGDGSPLLFLSGSPTQYFPREGSGGSSGRPGAGGGGGGGGSGRAALVAQAGAGGGQGGQGGGIGRHGGPGDGGGGSFGVYVSSSNSPFPTYSAATIVDGSVVHGGHGGTGGAGAVGTPGEEGGAGGAGGTVGSGCGITSGAGGAGGQGGNAGKGGNGGGGGGGPSVGLITFHAHVFIRESTLTSDAGGAGGAATSPATPGVDGLSAPFMELSTTLTNTDFDDDGVLDASDECVEIAPTTDADGDGCPDRAPAVADDDHDGLPNSHDTCPAVATGGTDANGDGCPDDPGGGNTPGGGNAPDTRAPILTFAARAQRSLKTKALRWSANSDEACTLKTVAKLGTRKLGSLTKPLTAGTTAKLTLRLSKKALSRLRTPLRRRKKVTVTLRTSCADAAGNKSAKSLKLVVKR
jgi:hypothetical protein